MPRGKPATVECQYEIRLTPSDGEPITDWKCIERPGSEIVICEEGGGDTGKKLHYHGYLKTTISEKYMPTLCKKLAREDPEYFETDDKGEKHYTKKGSCVYSCTQPHENTIGYVVKLKKIVYRHGYTDRHIEEFFEKSDQYNREKSKDNKRKTREKAKGLIDAVQHIRQEIKDGKLSNDTLSIYHAFEHFYGERPLPSRSILETAIKNLESREARQVYYLKNIY